MRQGKGKKATLISVVVAAMLAIALMIAGTLLRMNSREMALWPAFKSFMHDTFLLNQQN